MSQAITSNTEAPQTFYNNSIPQATRTKVQNIISLYSDCKIAQLTTADSLSRKLTIAKTNKEKLKWKKATTRFMTNRRIKNNWAREWHKQKKTTTEQEEPTQDSQKNIQSMSIYTNLRLNQTKDYQYPSETARVGHMFLYICVIQGPM